MQPHLGIASIRHILSRTAIAAVVALLLPGAANAQSSDTWTGTVSPMYLWASELSGDTTVLNRTVPVFLSFSDAADKLAAAFSVHLEAQRGRAGLFGDVSFVRLSTSSQFTLQSALPQTITGELDLDNTFVEAGVSYVVNDISNLAVIAGVRTFTIGTGLEFSTETIDVTPVDGSRTAVSGFGGVTFRPAITDRFRLLSRADIGGGSGLSWSGLLGVEFLLARWAGVAAGYKALGVDFGSDSDDDILREYDVTYYGPIFGFNLHWGRR
jgi:hypothetical protein